MGFINIMKEQENPDGAEGHRERELLQEIYKKAPTKKKFSGKGRGKSEWMLIEEDRLRDERAKERLKEIWTEKDRLKSRCEYYKEGCTSNNCPHCRKNPHRQIKALKKLEKRQQPKEGVEDV